MFKKPNFLIIGVSKSATTSLSKYLSKHKDIYIPNSVNEPRFFVKNVINKLSKFDPLYNSILKSSVLNDEKYFGLYEIEKKFVRYGEGSVHYFNHPYETIKNIKKYVGDVPIIVILRDPVSRMISNWRYIKEDFFDFKTSLKVEQKRIEWGYNSFWLYKEQSIYYRKLKYFLKNFSNVLVLIYENFKDNPKNELRKCFEFLNVKPIENINIEKMYNKTQKSYYLPAKYTIQLIKEPLRYYFFSRFIVKYSLQKKMKCFLEKTTEVRFEENYYKYFKDDIIKVENLIKKDLSCWKGDPCD